MLKRTFSAVAWLCVATLASCNLQPGSQADSKHPATASSSAAGYVTVHNDFYWVDDKGARIQTRSGCLCNFNGTYYWYGGAAGFRDQMCYTSTDLIHWSNRGVVLHVDVSANRIDVLYNESTRQYVMVLKYDGNGAHLGIATAEKPDGPFTFKSSTLVDGALMGDMSVFVDDDRKAYLAYVSWAVGTNAQHGLYLMSPDYLTLDKRVAFWDIPSREANHVFKRNGIYYYGTSRTAGIQSSGTSYYTAKNLTGPWSPAKPLPTPGSTNSWDSQVDFIYPFKGTQGTLYMYVGDRWVKDVPHGRNGDYIFLPMEFDGDDPVAHYYQDWELNVAAGTWRKFDPARNLAAGKPVTASSEAGANLAKNVTAPKTYENYVNSHWDSAPAPDAQWISVDLGAPTDINRVILKWNTSAARDFKIQTSLDNAAWNDVFSTNLGASYSVTDEKFKTTAARYVRMVATAHAPIPFGGRGGGRGGRGRGGRGATQPATATGTPTQPATEPATQAGAPRGGALAGPPAAPTGYSLFDFQVLKD